MPGSKVEEQRLQSQLKIFESRLATYFQRVQIAYDLISTVREENPQTLRLFRARCRDLEETKAHYCELVESINEIKLQLNPESIISHQNITTFEDLFYSCQQKLSEINVTVAQVTPVPSTSQQSAEISFKLPKIPLRSFSGNLTEFIPWYNLFSSVISQSAIPKVQKFLYLQSCLEGEALSLVKHLPATDANYDVAINILVERYQSQRQLASAHVEKLLNLDTLTSESYEKLRSFHEILTEQYSALEALELPNLADFILFFITFRKLPPTTRRAFESQRKSDNVNESLPTFKNILDFLNKQCKILETSFIPKSQIKTPDTAHSSRSSGHNSNWRNSLKPSQPSTSRRQFAHHEQSGQRSYVATSNTRLPRQPLSTTFCPLCPNVNHSIYTCPKFRSLSIPDRHNKITSLDRCHFCLGKHNGKCASKANCLICKGAKGSHHTLLHPVDSPCVPIQNDHPNESSVESLVAQFNKPCTVLLGTAVVLIQDSTGVFLPARVLVDSGSQCSFLTKRFFLKLGLPFKKSNVQISGIGLTSVSQSKAVSQINLRSHFSNDPLLTTQVVVLENIAGQLPSQLLPSSVADRFMHLPLADPDFFKPSQLDGILGAELFPLLCKGKSQSFGPGLPSAMPSVLGWIIMGPVDSSLHFSVFFSEVNLDESIKKFWEIEQPPSQTFTSPEDQVCEDLYLSQHSRRPNGHYVVPLLVKETAHTALGGTFAYALRCLRSTERKLLRNPELKQAYEEFMRHYEEAGFMRKLSSPSPGSVFIPHHAIFNPSSLSTKVRVVFNGSAPSASGVSLNQVLYTGPKLQGNITEIISRFRFHVVAFTADICKMYLQIWVNEEDTKFQNILWRYSPEDPVSVYQLLVVTWGLRSSPYLACRTLLQLADDEANHLPNVSNVIRNHTYIDDVISGAPTLQEALRLQADLISVFSKGGFQLRKWSSNNKALLTSVPSEQVQHPLIFADADETCRTKVLGLQWNPSTDDFSYKITPLKVRSTKREILSDISKLYDPMGWLSPVIFHAKCLIQRLWTVGVSWDEPIPSELQSSWRAFLEHFPSLANVRVPRLILGPQNAEYSLLAFSDASERGYASVVYLHLSPPHGQVSTHIIMAKSRVAPLKTLSVPRLELCGALLSAKLIKSILPLLSSKIHLSSVFSFCDSTVALTWIKTSPHLLKSFVANRVAEIISTLSPSVWHHIPSEENPADCASRGMMPNEILDHSLWFSGPSWLSFDRSKWPVRATIDSLDAASSTEFKQHKEVFTVTVENTQPFFLLERYSSFQRLLRITSWVLRAIYNIRCPKLRLTGPLSSCELKSALEKIIKFVQKEHFSQEISLMRMGQQPLRFRSLSPFLDPSDLLRVGGRLSRSQLPHDAKHPLLLPKKSSFTNLLIDYYHQRDLHPGPRALLATIQQNYWIISARQVIRSRLSKCLPCFRMRRHLIQPQMSDLPLSRVRPARPFLTVGTDFGGPFLIKESNLRKARTLKAYLCLFVCFTTKAVHLEVVSDLSTDAFLAALDRFISRRGLCTTIHSDCGTNYVGANRYLTDMHQLLSNEPNQIKVLNYCANKQIAWKFSPPGAPHFGGLFEAGIKSAKHLLLKVVGQTRLTFEQLTTIFTKVEGILNSRPLCQSSTDPSDLQPLTPGHFLIGGPLNEVPEENLLTVPANRLKQWQLLRQLYQTFWRRWSKEYLSTLMQRHKWTTSQPNLRVGDLVLCNDDHSPPRTWPLARVTQIHPGPDGIVRVVTLRTSTGLYQRPVVKLAPLPSSG